MCRRFANQQESMAAWDSYFNYNNKFASLHPRMLLIFGLRGIKSWFNEGGVDPKDLDLHFHGVGKTVNKTENQDGELISEQ